MGLLDWGTFRLGDLGTFGSLDLGTLSGAEALFFIIPHSQFSTFTFLKSSKLVGLLPKPSTLLLTKRRTSS